MQQGSTDIDGEDVSYDSEFFDLLQSVEDASAVSIPTPPVSFTDPIDAHDGPAPTAAVSDLTSPASADTHNNSGAPGGGGGGGPNVFMVGGSIFRRGRGRRFFLKSGGNGLSVAHARLLDPHSARNGVLCLLNFGSLYCPFTRQFFSLRSPHWEHLSAAGFGIDVSLRGGRRVDLVRPRTLYRVACAIQGRPAVYSTVHRDQPSASAVPGDTSSQPSGAVSGAGQPPPASRVAAAAAVYERLRWGRLLRATLGATLERLDVSDLACFRRDLARHTAIGSDDAQVVRRVPVNLRATGETFPETWADGAPDDAAAAAPNECMAGVHTDATAAALARALRDEGKGFLWWRGMWRRQVLQTHCKFELLTHNAASAAPAASAQRETDDLPPRSLLGGIPLFLPLLELPPLTRAAFLTVPFELKAQPSLEHMRAACDWVLRRMRTHLVAACTRDSGGDSCLGTPLLYFCPLEHSIDYSGLLDVVAFPVLLSEEEEEDGGGDGRVRWSEDKAVPILSLGMECAPVTPPRDASSPAPVPTNPFLRRPRVVVFRNAHLLSKRAVGRLLDQWTRNGAAASSVAQRAGAAALCGAGASGGTEQDDSATSPAAAFAASQVLSDAHGGDGSKPKKKIDWKSVLRVQPFAELSRSQYANPFGVVQPIFVSLEVERTPPPPLAPRHRKKDSSNTQEQQQQRQHGGFAVSAVPHRSVFLLEEPLSASLLRFLAEAPDAATREMVQADLLRSAQRDLPPSLTLLKKSMTRLRSGRLVLREHHVTLGSDAGRQLLQEAYAALADACAADRDGTPRLGASRESVLTNYPFLSQITCQHALLNAFRITRVSTTGKRGDDTEPERAKRASPAEESARARRAASTEQRFRVVTVPSRLEERQLVAQGTEEATRLHLADSASKQRLPRKKRQTSEALQAAGQVRGGTSLHSQLYTSFVEPSVLAGPWSHTLLFCAPVGADVLLLRQYLLERLRGRQVPAADVDIFHIDFIVFARERRCRLFGCRALLGLDQQEATTDRWCVGGDATEGKAPVAAATAAFSADNDDTRKYLTREVGKELKRYAACAYFFPVWTYEVVTASSPGRGDTRQRHLLAERHSQHTGRSSLSHYYAFTQVSEAGAVCVPNLVERRLFALAAAQHPDVTFALGVPLVLTAPVHVLHHGDGADAPDAAGTATVVALPGARGHVVGFVSARDVAARRLEAVPENCRWHLARAPAAALASVAAFMEQQRQHTTALPIVSLVDSGGAPARCGAPPAGSDLVLLPYAFLTGGYRSLHYYALPLLHLPAHVLATPAAAPQQPLPFVKSARKTVAAKGRRGAAGLRLSPAAPPTPFCYAASSLLHPYHAHPHDRSVLCMSPGQRTAVLQSLLDWVRQSDADDDEGAGAFSMVEDVLFDDMAWRRRGTETAAGLRWVSRTAAGEERQGQLLGSGAATASGDLTGAADTSLSSPQAAVAATTPGAPAGLQIVCSLLTELSLFTSF